MNWKYYCFLYTLKEFVYYGYYFCLGYLEDFISEVIWIWSNAVKKLIKNLICLIDISLIRIFHFLCVSSGKGF